MKAPSHHLIRQKGHIMLKTTRYPKNVFKLSDYPHKVVKPSSNKKLGKSKKAVVQKGTFKGYRMYTLTLTERDTCPTDCHHWQTCFGNNMPFAHRLDHSNPDLLMMRISQDIHEISEREKVGALIRLHILGDFFSTRYVRFWDGLLQTYPNIAAYGYTAYSPTSNNPDYAAIGWTIGQTRRKHGIRFSIRHSGQPDIDFSANSLDVQKPEKGKSIHCPEQTGKAENCTDCVLCWQQPDRQILFATH